jgi:intein/homing endonuclease
MNFNKIKEGDWAVVPENIDLGPYTSLTNGKKYEIILKDNYSGNYFNIIADSGNRIFCCPKNCFHLNENDWIFEPKNNENEL